MTRSNMPFPDDVRTTGKSKWEELLFAFLMLLLVATFSSITGCNGASESEDASEIEMPADSADLQKKIAMHATALEKVERLEIVKEPEYSETPLYLLASFGNEGTKQVWFVRDGLSLFIDRNSNGDLTDDGDAVKIKSQYSHGGTDHLRAVAGAIADGEFTYDKIVVNFADRPDGVTTATIALKLSDGVTGATNSAALIPMPISSDTSHAPVVRFEGNLTLSVYQENPLVIGEEVDFYTIVGTAGAGYGSFSAIDHSAIPEDAHPEVEFEFASREPGGEPIKLKACLDQRC